MVSVPTCKDVTNEQLDNWGNRFAWFLKRTVVVGSFIGLVGFLGCIATTISPPAAPGAKLAVAPVDIESHLVPVEVPPDSPEESSVWVTAFTPVDVDTHRCREMSTGIEARCEHTDTALIVSIIPTSGKWLSWSCALCKCDGCPQDIVCGNQTVVGCYCQTGCMCNEQDPDVHLRICRQTADGDYKDYPPTDRTLTTEYQLFATLTNIGYLLFLTLIFISELQIQQFEVMAKLLTFWPMRAAIQLFLGVQLVNTTTTQAATGHYDKIVHHLALIGGWLLVFTGMAHLVFYGIYMRSIRPAKFCGIMCMCIIVIIVPIGAAMGTTKGDSSGSG
eukprot:TRINITY_DN19213_c0_g1_i1.p1 TRINITY_DN19213_c0_g1~~TRINITY_DN19213_c0_g1_i1.p1  ORF type:complete len:332 (+),score=57.61 TRINITY_DN19213_c0_g1_i1:115-1110(+)